MLLVQPFLQKNWKVKVPYKKSGLRTYLLITGILSFCSSPTFILISLPFFILGIAIRIWAKGCLYQNREISKAGPYRFVRHPFYLGTFFLDLSLTIMSGFFPLMIAFPFFWFLVYLSKMKKEERKMIEIFGDSYREYQKKVPMFIPYRTPLKAEGRFSWKNPNVLRTEIPRTVRFICYPLLFFLLFIIKNNGMDSLQIIETAVLSSTIFSLYFLSWIIKRYFHGKEILPFSSGILLLVILAGFFINWGEVECDYIIWPIGIAIVFSSLLFKKGVFSEWLAAVGLSLLFELIWLIFILTPFYLALFLDNKLSYKSKKSFLFIVLTGIILAAFKEAYLGDDLFLLIR